MYVCTVVHHVCQVHTYSLYALQTTYILLSYYYAIIIRNNGQRTEKLRHKLYCNFCHVGFEQIIRNVEGKYTLTGEFIPMVIKVGDMVVLPTQGFTKLPFDGEEYFVGPENQILARVSKDAQLEAALKDTEDSLTKDDINDLTDI